MPDSDKTTLRLTVETAGRNDMCEITQLVAGRADELGIRDGFVIVYVPHTTAGVTIQENADPDVKHDILAKLDRLFPRDEPFFRHAEGNSDSHLKAIMVGTSQQVLIGAGRLRLGRWQGIYLCEFDGPRRREVICKYHNLAR